MQHHSSILVMACLSLVAVYQPASGAEWQVDRTVRLEAGYDDNIRMDSNNGVSSAQVTLSPSAIFSVSTPTSGASSTLVFDFRRFEADSGLNDDNVRLTSRLYHNRERLRFNLDLSFINDTTLDSQLDATGVVFDRKRRQTLSVSPSVTYAFNARTSLNASYGYNSAMFKNAGQTGLVDFVVNQGQVSMNRVLSERSTASVTLSASKTDNDINNESTTVNLQGGASYKFSETLSSSLFVGFRRTDVDASRLSTVDIKSGNTTLVSILVNQNVSSSSSGSTFNASLTKSFLRGDVTLSATRSISTDTNGDPIETTRLNSSLGYRFSETLSSNLNLGLTSTKADTGVSSGLDRKFYQAAAVFTWKLKKFFSLSGSYRYRKQTFDTGSDDATQNVANLTLTYRWPRIAASR